MSEPPIMIEGPEQSLLDAELPDGGLPPAVGVRSYQLFRASKDVPELTDGRGWTYHHHVDMACWRGRLYVGWNSCERDEDVWPSRELLSTSADGASWTPPVELFPQRVSTPLRMYFYHAANGRMLAIAGLRADTTNTSEEAKGGLVVREIREDHSLGEIFALRITGFQPVPAFQESSDVTFVESCYQLLADNVYLEQQDRGRLLGERRMKWHDPAAWPGGVVPGDNDKWVAGKAYSFFRRHDGALVGVSKMGWTTTSHDDGKTWSQPSVPPTLVTGKAKVWAQQARDGRYALVYNPSRRNRFPLAIVTGDDGVRFRDMRIVQGELPVQRYAGLHRSIGPQYVRGISHWSDDGSRREEQAMWLVYSMNKEDIWVSRVPLPVTSEAAMLDADAPLNWSTYCPKWAGVEFAADGTVRLQSRDPYDDACAVLSFPPAGAVEISLELSVLGAADVQPEIAVLMRFGSAPRARFSIADQPVKQHWQPITLRATAAPGEQLNRVVFRTGPLRGIGGSHPVPAGSDRQTAPRGFEVRALHVRPLE